MLNQVEYELTEEQSKIVNTIKDGAPLVKINAFAGTGKTFTLVEVSKYFLNKKVLYIAFNKAIQLEAKEKFDACVAVKTTHSLAYSGLYGFMKQARVKKGDYKNIEIAEMFNVDYKTASLILTIFNAYCNSGAKTISEDDTSDSIAKSYAIQLFTKMANNEIEITHSFYLKLYQLKLLEGAIRKHYDLVLLDEAQDTNDVTLSIFYSISATQRVVVGDRHQQIYSFRGGVNAIAKIKAELFHLTKSFRFNQLIANKATEFLKTFKKEKLSLKGSSNSSVSLFPENEVYIARTNSRLIDTMSSLLDNGCMFKTIREPYLIFGLALNVLALNNGEELDKGYSYLYKFIKLYEEDAMTSDMNRLDFLINLAEETEDIELLMACKIAQKYEYSLNELYEIANEFYNSKDEASIFLTTAHTAKGLEWEKATVLNDFNITKQIAKYFIDKNRLKENNFLEAFLEDMSVQGRIKQTIIDELNLYYVAITRAKKILVDETEMEILDNDKNKINQKIFKIIKDQTEDI